MSVRTTVIVGVATAGTKGAASPPLAALVAVATLAAVLVARLSRGGVMMRESYAVSGGCGDGCGASGAKSSINRRDRHARDKVRLAKLAWGGRGNLVTMHGGDDNNDDDADCVHSKIKKWYQVANNRWSAVNGQQK